MGDRGARADPGTTVGGRDGDRSVADGHPVAGDRRVARDHHAVGDRRVANTHFRKVTRKCH
jgi:hypothetical protein